MRKPSPSMIVALLGVFLGLSGVGVAATGGNFILGQSNSANNTSALASGVTTGPTLELSNSGAKPAARFNTTTGVPPIVVNNGTKIANLNADQLDGIDSTGFLPKAGKAADADRLDGINSTGFVPAAAVRRFGPVVTPRTPNSGNTVYPIVSVGQFSFSAFCYASQSGLGSQVTLLVSPSAAHSAYAGLTNDTDGSARSNPDMAASGLYTIAHVNVGGTTTQTFTPATGELLAPNGQEVFYNVYMGQNLNGQTGCVFGGSFVVK
jgi:hypothetical protein